MHEPEQFSRRLPLDGLRGVFVLMVILYHLDFEWIRVGYVGVDAFFVLSGFVITATLAVQHTKEDTAVTYFAKFYARRFLRLLPVSALVLLTAALFTRFYTTAANVDRLRSSFLCAGAYSENWYLLWASQDYFSHAIGRYPILHYWSLAVEEQFYLVWPLVLFICYKIGGTCQKVYHQVLFLALAFAAFTVFSAFRGASTIFLYYGTQFRIYQLLVGACLSFWQRVHGETFAESSSLSAALSYSGFGCFFGLCLYPFEINSSVAGGLSTGCMVLMIIGFEGNSSTLLATILSSTIFQKLGLYSYAMYLWHYPLIYADEIIRPTHFLVYGTNTNLVRGVFLVLGTIMLSALSNLLIENPLKRVRFSPFVTLLGAAFISLLLFGSLTLILPPSRGFAPNPELVPFNPLPVDSVDSNGIELGPARFVGDSFLSEWSLVLPKVLNPYDETFYLSHPWMKVIPDYSGGNADGGPTSSPLWDAINRQPPPKSLILFCYSFITNRHIRSIEPDSAFAAQLTPEWVSILKNGAAEALKDVSPATKIVIVLPHRTVLNFGSCIQSGDPSCRTPAVSNGFDEMCQALVDFGKETGITVVDFNHFICPNRICENVVNGTSQFRDNQHISYQYAEMVAPFMLEVLGPYF